MDLLIKNGCIVGPTGKVYADIGVKNGKICSLTEPGLIQASDAEHVLDANHLFILPGCIDAHVHFRDPGFTDKEDFLTGSEAAAAGGITMVFDMPNTRPLIIGRSQYQEKVAAIEGRSFIDYSFLGLVTDDNIHSLTGLVSIGVRGFKAMMGVSAMKTPTVSDARLLQALKILKGTNCPVIVHAENTDIIDFEADRLKKQGRTDYLAHMESRPGIAEKEAVQRAITFAEEAGGKLHIAHITSKESVEVVRQAKARGVDVTAETAPHNLVLSDKDYQRLGPAMTMNPPVRSEDDQNALWAGLLDGTVDMISTDHSPHLEEEKYKGNVWESVSGFVGIETSVSIMLTQVNSGRISLEKYVEISSVNPARLFGIYPMKGCIGIGSDADFTIVDMNRESIIKKEKLKSKTKVTPFDGFRVKGVPVYTVVRGKIVMENGTVKGEPSGLLI